MRIVIDKNLTVPMRDGVTLSTDVYRPDGPGPFPTLVQRTPYNKEFGLTGFSFNIMRGVQAYSGVKVPVLAIFAIPHAMHPQPGDDEAKQKARIAEDLARTGAQVDAFQAGNPQAHLVRLPNAEHFVFRSNEADVQREMNIFLSSLP